MVPCPVHRVVPTNHHPLRRRAFGVVLIASAAISCTGGTPPESQSVESGAAVPAPAATGAAAPAVAGPCDSAETQADMTRCWADEQRTAERRSDEALTRAVEWLRGRDQGDAAARFEKGHAAWAAYREAHGQAVAAVYAGGSMAPMQEAQCRADLAAQRTRALETILADANQ